MIHIDDGRRTVHEWREAARASLVWSRGRRHIEPRWAPYVRAALAAVIVVAVIFALIMLAAWLAAVRYQL